MRRLAPTKEDKWIQESDDEEEESDEEIDEEDNFAGAERDGEKYDKLKIFAEDDHEKSGIDFKYCPDEKYYFLPGDFCIPKDIYENLFKHQKKGV